MRDEMSDVAGFIFKKCLAISSVPILIFFAMFGLLGSEGMAQNTSQNFTSWSTTAFQISNTQTSNVEASNQNVLKVNTLSLLLGTGSIFYERKLAENRSAQAGAAFLRYEINETTFTGLILTPEYRFYMRGNALSGPYLAPYGRFQKFSLKSGGDKGTYRNLGGGVLFGRQWITKSDFTMDLFFGGHYGNGKISVESGDEEDFETDEFEGFRPRIGFAIGFAF